MKKIFLYIGIASSIIALPLLVILTIGNSIILAFPSFMISLLLAAWGFYNYINYNQKGKK